jgi:hypothetical protein
MNNNDENNELIELKKQEEKEKIYWANYNNTLLDLVKDVDIYQEVSLYQKKNNEIKKSFFYRLSRVLGF